MFHRAIEPVKIMFVHNYLARTKRRAGGKQANGWWVVCQSSKVIQKQHSNGRFLSLCVCVYSVDRFCQQLHQQKTHQIHSNHFNDNPSFELSFCIDIVVVLAVEFGQGLSYADKSQCCFKVDCIPTAHIVWANAFVFFSPQLISITFQNCASTNYPISSTHSLAHQTKRPHETHHRIHQPNWHSNLK